MMKPLSWILAPVDFSDQSRGMLRYAKVIADHRLCYGEGTA